jgi:hypothetical protein
MISAVQLDILKIDLDVIHYRVQQRFSGSAYGNPKWWTVRASSTKALQYKYGPCSRPNIHSTRVLCSVVLNMFSIIRLTALLALATTLAMAAPATTPTCVATCSSTDGNGNALTRNVPEPDIDLLFCQWAGSKSNFGYYVLEGDVRLFLAWRHKVAI